MRKYFLIMLLLVSVLFAGCSKYCIGFSEKEQSWGTQYDWAERKNGELVFYTLLESYSDNTLYVKSSLDTSTGVFQNVRETQNVTINEIVRVGGKVKSIKVNNINYVFE